MYNYVEIEVQTITCIQKTLDIVTTYEYLGAIITNCGRLITEVSIRRKEQQCWPHHKQINFSREENRDDDEDQSI